MAAWGDGKPGKPETGISLIPFKRSVEWQLVEQETRARAAAEKAGLQLVFNPLTMADAGCGPSNRGPGLHSGHLWAGGILTKDPQVTKVAAAEEKTKARLQEAADATARVQGRWLEKYTKATVEGPAAVLRLASECGGEIQKLRVTELEAIIIWKTKARVATDIKEATGEATQKKALVTKVKTLLIPQAGLLALPALSVHVEPSGVSATGDAPVEFHEYMYHNGSGDETGDSSSTDLS